MKDWRPYVVGAVAAALGWLAGLAILSAVFVGVAAAAGVLVLTRVDVRPDPGFERKQHDRRHGARGEVQELAWAMVARDGRTSDRMVRRVRELSRSRLARHGLDLDDPADAPAIQELVGPRAFRTLTRSGSPHPKMSEITQAIDALDRIGATRKSGNT